MRTGSGSVVPCVLVLLLGTDAVSEETAAPMPGTLIRMTAPTVAPAPLIGTLVDSTERDLVVFRPETGKRAIPRSAITRLEWSRGRRRNAGRGAIWGAAILGGTLAGVGAVSEPQSHPGDFINFCSSRGACAATMGVTGAAGGALYGALIGLLIKTYDWKEAPPGSVRVTVTTEKGVGVRAAITFAW